ncbi:hypothetical protein [Saccharothrix sp.]|uniref:hypothetical protein n=1 Tax=Saccharothrix sp. TaxID=1873460 RepID=UPI0028125E70|nr:hypothetical protein [Saccharothrix sp.]
MPHALWLDLVGSDPAPIGSPGDVAYQLFLAVLESHIAEGPEGAPPVLQVDGRGIAILDLQLQSLPSGVRIGLALDSDLNQALTVGPSLARALPDIPELSGYRMTSFSVHSLDTPLKSGRWLPREEHLNARQSLAGHLPWPIRRLIAQYLLAGAAADLAAPDRESLVNAADLVAEAVERPWDGDLTEELGTLLIAACRAEQATGDRRPLTGRGEGDRALAQALLDATRHEHDHPLSGFDDDQMRGHALVHTFMDAHDLRREPPDRFRSPETALRHRHEQVRAVLWAGLRALATMGGPALGSAPTPWVWLASLGSDSIDDTARWFATRDLDDNAQAAHDAELDHDASAKAHMLVQIALRAPHLLAAAPATAAIDDPNVTADPLNHLIHYSALALGADVIERAATTGDARASHTAAALAPILRAIETARDRPQDTQDEIDLLSDLFETIEDMLPEENAPAHSRRRDINALLGPLIRAHHETPNLAFTLARDLITEPAEAAGIAFEFPDGRAADHALTLRILAAAAAVGPELVAAIAADLPALHSDDPRDEPALRNEATNWWNATTNYLHYLHTTIGAVDEIPSCPEPGSALLRYLADRNTATGDLLDDLSTADTVVAVTQVISVVSIWTGDPSLPGQILLTTD